MGAMPVPNGGNAASIAPQVEPSDSTTRQTFRMRTRAAAALVFLVAVACTGEALTATDPTERAVAIYAAVVEHMVTEEGQPSGFPVVYVLDHSVERASDPDGGGGVIRDFPAEIRAGIQESLEGVAPVEFIPGRDAVIGPEEQGSTVEGGGILLTLGPITGEGDRVEVPASSYLGNLAATWQTWIVERSSAGWRVTGTTGPVAIS
jgi:hypothetical protein